jgi:hypothetical protein
MPFDSFYSSAVAVPSTGNGRRSLQPMDAQQMEQTVEWVNTIAEPIGGWRVAADCTFGSGDWPGRRRGSRRDRRDLLVSTRKRGFDPDDALRCFRMFMDRVLPDVTWFAGVEPNPDHSRLNPGFHLHSMFAGCEDIHRNTAARKWREENGLCKITPIRNLEASTAYCTKHLVKRGALYGWKVNSAALWLHLTEQAS